MVAGAFWASAIWPGASGPKPRRTGPNRIRSFSSRDGRQASRSGTRACATHSIRQRRPRNATFQGWGHIPSGGQTSLGGNKSAAAPSKPPRLPATAAERVDPPNPTEARSGNRSSVSGHTSHRDAAISQKYPRGTAARDNSHPIAKEPPVAPLIPQAPCLAQHSLQNVSIFLGVNGDADTPACTSFSRSGEQDSRRSATPATRSARSCRASTI